MRALLDTHAIVFAWSAPEQLSQRARAIIEDSANELIFSQVSTLEICLKHRIGKLELPERPERYIPSRIQRFGMQYLPLEDADIFGMQALPLPHRDPFDWLLLSIANRLKVPFITRDAPCRDYPVRQIW